MSQDLRLYSLSLIFALMLLGTPGRADYAVDCPPLAVPIQLNDGDIWHDDDSGDDYRSLFPYDTSADVTDGSIYDGYCSLEATSGTYYDNANHLWVLDDDLTCEMVWADDGDFRSGYEY